jgi:hypothetical protein
LLRLVFRVAVVTDFELISEVAELVLPSSTVVGESKFLYKIDTDFFGDLIAVTMVVLDKGSGIIL